MPCATKEAANTIFQNGKQIKVEDCTEVAMAAVPVYLAKHKFNKPLLEMQTLPPFIQNTHNKIIMSGDDLFPDKIQSLRM